MPNHSEYSKASVLVVGAGPAGLSTAIQLKVLRPEIDVVVIDKSLDLGNHNLSGAVLEKEPLSTLLDAAKPGWRDTDEAKQVLANVIDKDDIMFLLGKNMAFGIFPLLKLARKMGLAFGQMIHHGDYSVSISRLTKWLGGIARGMGIEVLTGFAADHVVCNGDAVAEGVKLVDQGIDKEGHKQPNYVEGETIQAKFIVLAEGCDGLVTERFVESAGLKRRSHQLYSIGVKELIKVTPEQYNKFTKGRVVHAMGYPIWTPVLGPGMFGGGIVYAGEQDHLAVGMIVGLDWKYHNFNAQDALVRFKEHKFVKQFIEGGTVVEAGAKMIPEGGWYAVPRDPQTQSIGKGNVMILGDSAGFVNMCKIKGLHNAIESGMLAAKAIVDSLDNPAAAAGKYTANVEGSNIAKEMKSAKNFRQTVAKFGPLQGMPFSVLGGWLPQFHVEKDYEAMTGAPYRLKPNMTFDKDTFTAVAATEHREEQPSHLQILDPTICTTKCKPTLNAPCVTFCPAGVYEEIHDQPKAANPSNCLHCKTCQRKCPFDNIRWTAPEGGGGPRYKRM
ncbi:MAG TPA: electron-transfer flavoprotein:ubiquinone oxidoreductase [Sedimentisphaerales bacterium]|nr:electron-transfer flavoprotein:ubiquinone oxidoreductase [Sedimentisphaerales bacterium]HNU31865.1 electron-transfer flavoprotein:ubiquinone oxidoreductase [Sedimentisphaerales bacterium]